MADIFISYASADRQFARRLADALEACGWSVWWDHSNLHGGQHFHRVIDEEIRGASVVIVVWSKTSVDSGWVRDEAMLALEEKKLVPLRIDMTQPPLGFKSIHTIDLSAWTEHAGTEPFQRLIKDLTHYLGPPTPSNRSERSSIPAAPDPQTAAPVAEDQQPAETTSIAEHSQTSPNVSLPNESTFTKSSTLKNKVIFPKNLMNVGKYFSGVLVALGIFWGFIVLGEKQQPKIESPTEASIPEPQASIGDAGNAQVAYNRGDYTTALNLVQPAAERGDQEAQYFLGFLYDHGRGVRQDDIEAARWYRKAADQGNAKAQLQLGIMYANSQGVQRNYAEAARWYQKAADQGNADAQYNLGILYSNGQSVPQDTTQARAWMQKAAVGGIEEAKKWLAKN
jgi:hypothetical protein